MKITPADARARAEAAYALAEAADHPRDKAALRSAAGAWEAIARGGGGWSHRPLQRALVVLKRDTAIACGPFQRPEPPRAPPPSAVKPPVDWSEAHERAELDRAHERYIREPATIDF